MGESIMIGGGEPTSKDKAIKIILEKVDPYGRKKSLEQRLKDPEATEEDILRIANIEGVELPDGLLKEPESELNKSKLLIYAFLFIATCVFIYLLS